MFLVRCRISAVFCLLAAFAPLLSAWNAAGHRAITFLTYSQLTPKARARVDAIIRAHPDYAELYAKGVATDPVDVARNAFTAASVWSDVIKGDARFSDTLPAAPGTRVLSGFPDMLRHSNWHYINTPFQKEFDREPIDPVNALTEIKRLLKVLRKDGPVTPEEAFALPWIIHIISDVHQPLHTVSKFSRTADGRAEQDKGGNACFLAQDRNLHSLWDGILGTNMEDGAVARLAASLQDHQGEPKKLDLKPETWLREGAELSLSFVYAFPGNCGSKDNPLTLPAGYREKAHQIALQRGAMAAYRLAAVLNERLD
jgi:hypothetical protein